MKSVVLCSVAIVLALFVDIAVGEDDGFSFVKVQDLSKNERDQLLKQWEELPIEIRKRIDSQCLQLGLSSTGSVELIAIYVQNIPGTSKPQRLFHLRQTDLFGSRLLWSILIDADDEKYKVLFDIHQDGDDSSWLKLRDN